MRIDKKRKRIGGVALASLIAVACSHHDSAAPAASVPAPSAPPASGTIARGVLLQSGLQQSGSYSQDQLLALLSGNQLGKTLLGLAYTPACNITVYHMAYTTVDPGGNLTPASGALMVPNGTEACQGPRPIVEYAHGTTPDKTFNIANVSGNNNAESVLLAAVFAAQGYIVVAPNYVGYDTSTLGHHPYLNADQQSKDMIDALAAARSALPATGAPSTTDSGKLFVTGYSQGGFVAMATHRALQSAGVAVTAAAPMSGPYALSAFADAVFQGKVSMGTEVNLTLLVPGYQRAYGNLYTTTSDVFSAQYAAGIDTLLPSTITVSALETQGKLPTAVFDSTPPDPSYAVYTPATMPDNLAGVFAAGFGTQYLINNAYRLSYLQDAAAAPDGGYPALTNNQPPANPKNGLRLAVKSNDLRSWAPSAPVLLCGGNSDPTVFFFNTQLMQSYWTDAAPTAIVTVLDVDSAAANGDAYADLKNGFAAAKGAVIAAAVAGGAGDGGASAVLDAYHAGLVPPFCVSAAKAFFDAH